MRKLRLLRLLASGILTAAMTVTSVSAAFTDTKDHWAAEAIDRWSGEYSIIQGYDDGTFRPDNSITRGAFAGILDRFLKYQKISDANTFSDIQGNYWEQAILKLHASGVYLGNNGKALPTDTITRQQAVTMIARAFRIGPELADWPYEDMDQIAEYAKAYVAEMTARGYINDAQDNFFRPTDPITRAELVNILHNMVAVLVPSSEPVKAGEVVGDVLINSTEGAALEDTVIDGDLILAPGVQGLVTLTDVDISGSVLNYSSVEPVFMKKQPEKPKEEPTEVLSPEDVYTPGETTGEYITYDKKKIPIYEGRDALQLTAEDFFWEEDRLVYTGNQFKTRFGIDVSAYQNRASENQTIDWEAVAADGVEFVMVRIGLRGTSSGAILADAYYEENIRGAMEAGLETGVYFFAQAITVEEAIEEAEFVLDLLKDLEIDGPVAYDWEMHDSSYRVYGTAPEMATACAIAFCEMVEEAGYTPMIYAGQYVSYIKYDQGAISPYLSWYPEYKSEKSEILCPTFYYQMNYWQFSSSCSIDGIGGRVDANLQFIKRK
ncbi:MAG: S-layer homology domain-containing protein [Oscillibacter sp.]|nr:S-layer homology domain-containing protein [Oscillibacter sp.]